MEREIEMMMHATEQRKEDRTCVGCRRRDDRDALLRFAFAPDRGMLAPDIGRKLGGRGASVHPDRPCIDAAVRRGGFARAFRRSISARSDELCRTAAAQYRRRVEGLVFAASRQRALAVGTDAVREALRHGEVRLLVVAADAANRRQELEEAARVAGSGCVVLGNRASLGRLLGRRSVGVVAVLDARMAKELSRAAARMVALSEDA